MPARLTFDYTQAIRLNPSLARRFKPLYADAYFNTGVLYYNRRQKREALPYFEKAAQLGNSQAVQIVERIRRKLGIASQANPTEQAVEAFVAAGSLDEMLQAVGRFPFMGASRWGSMRRMPSSPFRLPLAER